MRECLPVEAPACIEHASSAPLPFVGVWPLAKDGALVQFAWYRCQCGKTYGRRLGPEPVRPSRFEAA